MSHSLSLTRAVIATLSYSAHFHYPLTRTELHLRLVKQKISAAKLSKHLSMLCSQGLVKRQGSYYYLPGDHSLVKQRKIYAKLSLPLRAYTDSLVPYLSLVPGVLAIYLTGGLALGNTDGHDDIDLMVITKSGRLWTTRLLLTLFTILLHLRRSPKSKMNMGKLCLNLYLTPRAFKLPKSRRTLYTAYELIQVVPLYDPDSTHAALLSANSWLSSYLPNYPMPRRSPTVRYVPCPLYQQILETLAYYLQYLYMRPKITREYITRDAAFFHPNNPAPKL